MMNIHDFSEALGNIDDRFISSAMNVRPKKRFRRYAVANFLLVMLIAGFNMTSLFRCGATKGDDGQYVDSLNVIIHNGAYYEEVFVNDSECLIKNNLPYEITEDMLGIPLGNAKDPMGNTVGNLYTYKPHADIVTEDDRTCRSVYINEDDGEYSYMLFCNYISFDSNTHTEFTELLSVYGIDEWQDIESIRIGRNTYTQNSDIKRIFKIFTSSYALGNDDYQNLIADCGMEYVTENETVSGAEEKKALEEIRIVSKEGVVINNITYYPRTDYIYWALSYFRLDESL